ncbi:hypothetical protein LJ656_03145 [Paraburkholderia sp. MMS20-SJTR3]|uniref:Uncharacterized protein n=1 Tax=Paraburkholderia sejongensis TaxID=2886946 RepID=A0ABS8JP16_9BURK|nr:hypothetical protein [Paraburkholderia sp. MMS20-SJTR3]MCC8391572.1 hypothetical protein [Paraburkholderia sp. MMS20-SJTR3]
MRATSCFGFGFGVSFGFMQCGKRFTISLFLSVPDLFLLASPSHAMHEAGTMPLAFIARHAACCD